MIQHISAYDHLICAFIGDNLNETLIMPVAQVVASGNGTLDPAWGRPGASAQTDLDTVSRFVYTESGGLDLFRIKMEGKMLAEHFSDKYEEYRNTTRRLIPFLY